VYLPQTFACITSQRSGRTDGRTSKQSKKWPKGCDVVGGGGVNPGKLVVAKATHTTRREGKGSAGSRKRIQNFSGNRSHFVIFANKRVKFQGAPHWGMQWIGRFFGWFIVWGGVLPQSPVGRHVRAIFGIQLTREIAHAD